MVAVDTNSIGVGRPAARRCSDASERRATVLPRAILATFIFSVGFDASAVAGQRGDWFKSLLQPDGESCCDVSDCTQTVAEWREDRWWAEVNGKWRAVPRDRILSTPHSLDGRAYVCSADRANDDSHGIDPMIYCFVPPNMGF